MKRLSFVVALLITAVVLLGCETSDAERLSRDHYRIKASIVQFAAGEPGYKGAIGNAANRASEKCPRGWTKILDEVQVIEGTRFVVWEVKCK